MPCNGDFNSPRVPTPIAKARTARKVIYMAIKVEQTVREYLTAYSNQDYPKMAHLTAPQFVFVDPAFDKIEGNDARGMFKMFIQNAKRSNMKITVVEVEAPEDESPTKVNARYDADYIYDGRPVINHMSSVFTVIDDKIVEQIDSFDFPAWAAQALGWFGWIFGSTSFLQKQVNAKARARLSAFVAKDPELSK